MQRPAGVLDSSLIQQWRQKNGLSYSFAREREMAEKRSQSRRNGETELMKGWAAASSARDKIRVPIGTARRVDGVVNNIFTAPAQWMREREEWIDGFVLLLLLLLGPSFVNDLDDARRPIGRESFDIAGPRRASSRSVLNRPKWKSTKKGSSFPV